MEGETWEDSGLGPIPIRLNKSAFVVPGKPGSSKPVNKSASQAVRENKGWKAMGSSNNKLKTGSPKMKDLAKKAWNAAGPEIQGKIIDKAIDTGKKVLRTREPGTSSNPSSHSSGYALSKAPNPKQISLDTGIIPNTYTSDWLDAKENQCSPLHMTAATIQIPTYAGSRLLNYWNKVISFGLQTKAQANVGFQVKISSDFSAANILTAFNALIYALQVYYYYSSIISFHSEDSNKNEGMFYLRDQLTPQALEDLMILQRYLASTPCPPKLNDYIRYLMGNFYTSMNQGSPLIKICPGLSSTTMINVADIATALTNLDTNANDEVFGLLRRAVPQWEMKVLYDVEPVPVYDANFTTIFANLPHKYYSTGNNFIPSVTTDDEEIAYNSFTNELDGGAFAACGIFNSVSGQVVPGLIAPPAGSLGTTNGRTRRSFYEVSGVKAFYDTQTYPFLKYSRQETYNYNDGLTAVLGVHLSGADRCKSVTCNTIMETSYNMLDYLMSWDTIPKSKNSGFNRDANDVTARRRRK